VTMSAARNVTATFNTVATSSSCTSTGATTLATLTTNSSGNYTSTYDVFQNPTPTTACAKAYWGAVSGKCYGDYAVQPNAYFDLPPSTSFSMWSQSASCWGINMNMPTNASNLYWSAPEVTRGFSFGYAAPLIASSGNLVSTLNTTYANATTPCPSSGTSSGVCVKWAMSVPGVATGTAINDLTHNYSNWNALLDIYFHAVTNPTDSSYSAKFDLQIYQMVMDWPAGGNPNWASYLLRTYTKKTIGGVTYLVSVNMQDPGTYGSGTNAWVGSGGTLNMVAMFVLPTYPTSASGSKSYLWGSATVTHDVGGIISWLSQTETRSGVTMRAIDFGTMRQARVCRHH
jgi:hypothetical protein